MAGPACDLARILIPRGIVGFCIFFSPRILADGIEVIHSIDKAPSKNTDVIQDDSKCLTNLNSQDTLLLGNIGKELDAIQGLRQNPAEYQKALTNILNRYVQGEQNHLTLSSLGQSAAIALLRKAEINSLVGKMAKAAESDEFSAAYVEYEVAAKQH